MHVSCNLEPVFNLKSRTRIGFRLRRKVMDLNAGAEVARNKLEQDLQVFFDRDRNGLLEPVVIPTSHAEVKEIRYLSATDATQRFGTGHTAGAIIVTRR